MANDDSKNVPGCLGFLLEPLYRWDVWRRELRPLNLDEFKAYEEGKHRRYSLLFAVNGGAFAIAKLFIEANKKWDGDVTILLGNLRLGYLSLGMMVFTGVMVWDLCAFGRRMHSLNPAYFGPVGRMVLLSIGGLILAGWLLAGWSEFKSWIA